MIIPPFDLVAASQAVDAMLQEFGQSAPYMVQTTLWNHRRGEDESTIAIYVSLARAFRKEGSTLAAVLTKVRAEMVARFGEPT